MQMDDRFGYIRVAVASPELRIGDVTFNQQHILQLWEQAAQQSADILLVPELALTGYSCQDLFYEELLLQAVVTTLEHLATVSAERDPLLIVGAPLRFQNRLYNCAVVIGHGQILGVVPKTFLPNSQEFYEERWFVSGTSVPPGSTIAIAGITDIPFGTDLLFQARQEPRAIFGIEICEDLWAPIPPSNDMAVAGATLFFNLSSSNELLGKAAYRRDLIANQSARLLAGYAYASAGPWESTTDTVFSGHSLIAENGQILAESERFSFSSTLILADWDVERLVHERLYHPSYKFANAEKSYRKILWELPHRSWHTLSLLRPLVKRPFVPRRKQQRELHCREVFAIQKTGLARRLLHVGSQTVVLGVSGGLDSTLALLVAVKAFDTLGWDRQGIHAVIMPGPGSSERTQRNAQLLAEYLQTRCHIIPIHDAVAVHLRDIDHPLENADVTVENAQARERTQILMDLANKLGGLVVGTGDLSELALGWCTFNGDHMSMYNVNAGVPKTLVQYLVRWCADEEFAGEPVATVLYDILETPISPELLPKTKKKHIVQRTEQILGPYIVHDFFLYFMLRYHFAPSKIFFLAQRAFRGDFSATDLLTWMETFYSRFFHHQFKRSVLPDGPKVGSVSLSPRTDWRMPSDATVTLWLQEVQQLRQRIRRRGKRSAHSEAKVQSSSNK